MFDLLIYFILCIVGSSTGSLLSPAYIEVHEKGATFIFWIARKTLADFDNFWHAASRRNCGLSILQDSVVTVLRWGGQNYSH